MDLLVILCFFFTQNVAVLGQLGDSLLALQPSTPSITHFVNDSFIIICQTVQRDVGTIWRDPSGKVRANTKGRVHIETKPGQLALVFEHIALADKGNWTCEAAATATTMGATRKSFELLVNQKITFDKTELVQSAREGRDATVYCFVKGDPVPDVSWLYNGEHISIGSSGGGGGGGGNVTSKHKRLSDGLFIKNVSQSDAGEYTCRAMRITPTFSDSDQITILLRIQHKPHWFDNETTPVQYAYIGGFVNISCDAMGEPPPSFKWVHDGKALSDRNNRFFYADYGSTLQIHVTNESQYGDYKCKVANELGQLERIIKLRGGQKPVGPTRFQLKRSHSDRFELIIKSAKYSNVEDNMHVLGYRVEYMSENDFKFSAGNWSYARKQDFPLKSGTFIIYGVDRNTTYLMRAASRNLAGLSDWSVVRIFATLANAARSSLYLYSWRTCLVAALGLTLLRRLI